MINFKGACLVVQDAKYVLILTLAGLALTIGTYQDKVASIIVLRASSLAKIHQNTINARIVQRIALNVII